MISIGSRIRQAREKLGLNQKQAANRMGITNQQLNHWEKDKNTPQTVALINLCRFLCVTPNYILGFSDFDADTVMLQRNQYLEKKFKKLQHILGDNQ